MPIYVYICQNCGEKFEISASFKDKIAGLNPVCPKCSSQNALQSFNTGLLILNNQTPFQTSCDPGAGKGCCG